jgi:hypothetical protein
VSAAPIAKGVTVRGRPIVRAAWGLGRVSMDTHISRDGTITIPGIIGGVGTGLRRVDRDVPHLVGAAFL